jgi:hypothetical protein
MDAIFEFLLSNRIYKIIGFLFACGGIPLTLQPFNIQHSKIRTIAGSPNRTDGTALGYVPQKK